MKTATRDWIAKAESDHLAALDLARRRRRPLPDMVCFHCQQSAEKYLKACLEEGAVPFPKTHDLETLLTLLLPAHPLLAALNPAVKRLTPFGVLTDTQGMMQRRRRLGRRWRTRRRSGANCVQRSGWPLKFRFVTISAAACRDRHSSAFPP